MPKKRHALSEEQARHAREFLSSIKTLDDRQRAARRIAKAENIKFDSAMRRLQRYTTTTGTQRRDLLKSPRVGAIIEQTPKRVFKSATFAVSAVFKASSDKRKRTIRFPLKGPEVQQVLSKGSKQAQAEAIASLSRFGGFVDSISNVTAIEVEEN